MTEKYVVVKGCSLAKLAIVAQEKYEAVGSYEYVAGPMSYEDCETYIESSEVVSGPYIPPENISKDEA